VLAVPTDLKNPESIAKLWEKIGEVFGHADVLVNNAGTLAEGTLLDTPADSWWGDFVSPLTLICRVDR